MEESIQNIQEKINQLKIICIPKLHNFQNIPKDFKPWECNLSPSALYNCSLFCRKQAGIKTPEGKWMSIKRWVTTTPSGINLPPGVYYSIKRKEEYEAYPDPHFKKTEYIVMMFPYGNVWSQISPGNPITEDWMFSEKDGQMILKSLMEKDAAHPLNPYFELCYQFMINNPDQIGIHMKRKRKEKKETGVHPV